MEIHPYFQYFHLSPEDFDSAGNRKYGNSTMIETRGGWPYFFPINCERQGLNVSKKYDDGSDEWLMMNGNVN